MRRLLTAIAFMWVCCAGWAQTAVQDIPELQRPKLVVGLVVDQMRWDYLTRYADRYCDGGFRRMMREGWNCNRTLINYLPCITAVGHTSIYTGSVPAHTGIVANTFFIDGKKTYCTEDRSVKAVGSVDKEGKPSATARAGLESPRNLLVTTMTDELRMATNFRAKTVGVALKDRASILPAGHSATGAYWMDEYSTNFITSTYYMNELPKWAKNFNAQKLGEKYAKENLAFANKDIKGGPWKLLYDEKTYVQSAPKNQKWENTFGYDLKNSPWGIKITFDMAKAAVEGENLGNNPAGVPDFLAVSISSTDMVGHRIGPNSIWIEDMYLRLDLYVADFMSYLDEKVGKGNWTLFLSADHAGAHNVTWRKEHKIPADIWGENPIIEGLNAYLREAFPLLTENPVMSLTAQQVHFTNEVQAREDYQKILAESIAYLKTLPEVSYAFDFEAIPDYVPEPVRTNAINGYCPHRSGQIQIVPRPGVTEDFSSTKNIQSKDFVSKGTNHIAWSPDDSHIPLIFMGWGVPHGWDNRTHHVVDIAATITALLNIQQPNACVGEVIEMKSEK